jgi:2-dehydro-3-deoxyphosphogluconate aldolase/(4S)-4-hydroxy-2-oxoglutarate aldolase
MTIEEILALSPVMPVVTISDASLAVPLARALVAGGVRTMEITLRTPQALQAVRAISREVQGAVVGVGTVVTPQDLSEAAAAGAAFAVSPGWTPSLLEAAKNIAIPFLPGAATAGEIMAGLERGYRVFKFFPAAHIGGVAALGSFAGPFPNVQFCPTGGIDLHNAKSFLTLPNVVCVGGSWITPAAAIEDGNFEFVEDAARDAIAMGQR